METFYTTCDNCGGYIAITASQSVYYDRLAWHVSCQCANCDSAIELDDYGIPPDAIRNHILDVEGKWELVVNVTGDSIILALIILSKALGLSAGEAGRMKSLMPGPVLTGTKTEMEWLRLLLADELLEAAVGLPTATATPIDISTTAPPCP